jgi:hypothetical protein
MAITEIFQSISFVRVLIALLAYSVYVVIHRLYYSSISEFPGPVLAAVTLWYVALQFFGSRAEI